MKYQAPPQYLAEVSFYQFLKQAWSTIHGGKRFVDGEHIKVICDHLQLVAERKIKKLLINIPPRFGKSTIISVAFPAWLWICNPEEQILCASYVAQFALRDSRKCRALMQSSWYQKYWGDRYQLLKDQNTKGRFDNTQKGFRFSTSSKGSVTAEGGSIIIVDDPNSAYDSSSKVERERRIEWWTQVLSTRLNDKKNDRIIVVQQRIHENDVSGYIIANDEDNEWIKLILPMEYEENRKARTVCLPFAESKIWEDWRTKEGELLWPEHIGEKEIKDAKNTLGSYGYAGQYQQRPSPLDGGIIKKNWFKKWIKPQLPQFEHRMLSCDPAISDSATASYSACTTWGVFLDDNDIYNVILLSMWRGRVGYPELRERLLRLSRDYLDIGTNKNLNPAMYRVDSILIENKATGDPLIRDLRQAGVMATPYNPTRQGDKEGRVQRITHFIENGLIWLPTNPKDKDKLLPWADEFLDAVASFPNAESRDLVDSMTQAFSKLRDSNMLSHSKNPKEIERYPKPKVLY
jgi:predicted phage terminase large subunit-like protein